MTQKPETKEFLRQLGYVIAITVNLVLIYVVNNLLRWHVPFLTRSFSDVLWAFDLSFGATIMGNILYLVYDDSPRFRHAVQLVLNIFAMISIYVLYAIFPFAADQMWESGIRISLFVVMAGVGIGFIAETVKLVRNQA